MLERRDRLLALIEKWQLLLRLADWDISLFEGEPGVSDTADLYYKSQPMKAEIAVAAAVRQEHEEVQILHEVLELVLSPMQDITETLINLLPQERQDNFREQRNLARHQAIHRITSALLGPHYEPYNVIKAH